MLLFSELSEERGGNQQLCLQQENKKPSAVNGEGMIHGAVSVMCLREVARDVPDPH